MNLNARQRLLVLGGLVLATLAVGIWLGDGTTAPETEVVGPSQSGSRAAPRGVAAGDASSGALSVNLEKFQSRESATMARDPFAFEAPLSDFGPGGVGTPGAHASSVAAPPPTAPALPFNYLGKMISGNVITAFLTLGDRNLVVREGDTIDALYRVEHVAESTVTLVYLPLGERQTLAMGDPSARPDPIVPERPLEQGSATESGRQIVPQPAEPAAVAIPQQSPVGRLPPPGQNAPSVGPVQSQPSPGDGQLQPFVNPTPPAYAPKEGVPVQMKP